MKTITNKEQLQLERFKVNHNLSYNEFFNSLQLKEDLIIECYTVSNNIKYAQIKSSFEGTFFDIVECSPEGQPVSSPYIREKISKHEIAERLYEGDWRLAIY
jgi:hypothetical protein